MQRAIVQPFILAMQALALALMFITGAINGEVIKLVILALPALAAGVAIGLLLFGRVPDAGFRRAVLVLLLVTSAGLVAKPHPAQTSDLSYVHRDGGGPTIPISAEATGLRQLACGLESRCSLRQTGEPR